MVKNQLQQWISRQAAFIKALFSNFCWESWVTYLETSLSFLLTANSNYS
jgi:hypothetical protein